MIFLSFKYVIFCPYFGKLPVHFNLWLISCEYNSKFKFIIFTDDNTSYVLPKNVEIIRLSFADFVKKVQKKLNFKIALIKPYKLCDFKPTYGYLFEEYLNGCQYWGYCDLDLIFGDIESFLPNDDYDKISYLGHLCLMKNTKEIRESFMLNNPNSKIDFKDILSAPINFGFDEIGDYGINNLLVYHNFKIFNYEKYIADINCLSKRLTMVRLIDGKFKKEKKKMVFSFEKGKIFNYSINSKELIEKKEYAYIHFQKRKMSNKISNKCSKFIITYEDFINFEKIDIDFIKKCQPSKINVNILYLKIKLKAVKNKLNRFFAIKKLIVGKKI